MPSAAAASGTPHPSGLRNNSIKRTYWVLIPNILLILKGEQKVSFSPKRFQPLLHLYTTKAVYGAGAIHWSGYEMSSSWQPLLGGRARRARTTCWTCTGWPCPGMPCCRRQHTNVTRRLSRGRRRLRSGCRSSVPMPARLVNARGHSKPLQQPQRRRPRRQTARCRLIGRRSIATRTPTPTGSR